MTDEQEQQDSEIVQVYKQTQPWGLAASIDLKNCDLEKITNAEYIKSFVSDLCELIKMKRFGETVVVNFGEDERVAGFSMTQLIETSLISAHFANASKAVYLDIFSCKEYPPYRAAEFAKERFSASDYTININYRY